MRNNIGYSKAKYAVLKLLRKSKRNLKIERNQTTEFIDECAKK